MDLKYYNDVQLRTTLQRLIDDHPYLGGEVQVIAQEQGFDRVSLNALKKETRELINFYKRQGWLDWRAMRELDSNWYQLCQAQIARIKISQDLVIMTDYACFLWLYSYKLADRCDDDGTISEIIGQVQELIDFIISQSQQEKNQSVTKKIVARFLKTASDKVALSWDSTYWLQKAAEIVTDKTQIKVLKELADSTMSKNPYYADRLALVNLIIDIKDKPALVDNIPKLAAENDDILNWHLKKLETNKDIKQQIQLLEKRTEYPKNTEDYSYRKKLMGLYKNNLPNKYYQSMTAEWRENQQIDPSFCSWLKDYPEFLQRFEDFLNTDKAVSSKAKIDAWIQLGKYNKAVVLFQSMDDRALINTKLLYFHELFAAGLDDTKMLIDFFVTGTGHMTNTSSDKNTAILRAIVEIGRVSGNHQIAMTALDELASEYSRRYTLVNAIPNAKKQLNSKTLRQSSLESAARFAFGSNYELWWY